MMNEIDWRGGRSVDAPEGGKRRMMRRLRGYLEALM